MTMKEREEKEREREDTGDRDWRRGALREECGERRE